ncbi:MAG: hypothetical protein V1846_03055 [Candidatus Komeilibacteria bacterium]
MRFDELPLKTEGRNYVFTGADFQEISIDRDVVLQEAALALEADPKFSIAAAQLINQLKAKAAIRQALKQHGATSYFTEEQERQIGADANAVLELFSKESK